MMEDKSYSDYDVFSNDNAPANEKFPDLPKYASGSIEGLHDLYHVLSGGIKENGSGHMGRVPVAAFDPMFVSFYIHH